MLSGTLGPATGSMMASTPRPRVSFPDPLADLLGLAVDNWSAPRSRAKRAFSSLLDHADHGEACHLREVNQRIPHAAGGGVDEHALALLRPHGVVEDVIGDLIIGERCYGVEVGALGQEKARLGRRHNVFGIVAAAMRPLARVGVDALAEPAGCDAGPDLLDRAGELGAGRRRERRHEAVGAGADQRIRHAHADRVRPDQDFARLRLGDRHMRDIAARRADPARGTG